MVGFCIHILIGQRENGLKEGADFKYTERTDRLALSLLAKESGKAADARATGNYDNCPGGTGMKSYSSQNSTNTAGEK